MTVPTQASLNPLADDVGLPLLPDRRIPEILYPQASEATRLNRSRRQRGVTGLPVKVTPAIHA